MKTIPKALVRLLAVAALAASAVVVGAPSAQAAIRIFPAMGGTCVGTQVLRCLELRFDDANERFRARAEITDAAGGSNANVEIVNVEAELEYALGDGVPSPEWERLESPFSYCLQGTAVSAAFTARFRWQNTSTGAWGEEVRVGFADFTCT